MKESGDTVVQTFHWPKKQLTVELRVSEVKTTSIFWKRRWGMYGPVGKILKKN